MGWVIVFTREGQAEPQLSILNAQQQLFSRATGGSELTRGVAAEQKLARAIARSDGVDRFEMILDPPDHQLGSPVFLTTIPASTSTRSSLSFPVRTQDS